MYVRGNQWVISYRMPKSAPIRSIVGKPHRLSAYRGATVLSGLAKLHALGSLDPIQFGDEGEAPLWSRKRTLKVR